MLLLESVRHHQQEQAFHSAKGLPALFPIHNAVLNGHIQWVVEYMTGFFKTHAVFAPVGEVLGLVPLESDARHRLIVIIYL